MVFLDPKIELISEGEPLKKLGINLMIAVFIFPLHSFIERRITRMSSGKLEVWGTHLFVMNPFPNQTSTYLAVRYSLEFVVVVLGITVSFWFNEWNEHQQELTYQTKDAQDLLQDLRSDEVRLDKVAQDTKPPQNTARIKKTTSSSNKGTLLRFVCRQLDLIGFALQLENVFHERRHLQNAAQQRSLAELSQATLKTPSKGITITSPNGCGTTTPRWTTCH